MDETMTLDERYLLPSGLRDEFMRAGGGADEGALARFDAEYLHRAGDVAVLDWRLEEGSGPPHAFHGTVRVGTTDIEVAGEGSGPLDAIVDALAAAGRALDVQEYHAHTVGVGSDASNVAYVRVATSGGQGWGVGSHRSMVGACVAALVSAINRF